MMKKLGFVFSLCIFLCNLGYAQSKKSCPPPCNGTTTYIFFEKFCCSKNDEFDLHCKHYEMDGVCQEDQTVLVSKWFGQTVEEELQTAKKDTTLSFHRCKNKDRQIGWKYLSDIAVFETNVYDSDFISSFFVYSYLDTGLPSDDFLVRMTTENFITYLCLYYNPKALFEKQKIAPFSFLQVRQENEKKLSKKTKTPVTPIKLKSNK